MKPTIAVAADLCLDMVLQGDVTPVYGQVEQLVDDYHIELGGSAAIFASQFTKLGGRVNLLGTVGKDFFGKFVTERLWELGIATEFVSTSSEYKTAVGLGLARREDRAMLTYPGSLYGVSPQDLRESHFLHSATHLHIASYFLLEGLQSYWARELPFLKQKGITVSLDTNWAPNEDWHRVHRILEYVDVFIPNEEEALRISGKTQVEEAGKWLRRFGCLVVIKRGKKGAMVFDGTTIQEFAIPNTLREELSIADTTGAGDNFDAGFLFGWLQDASLEECVQLAMRCGTASLRSIGGIAGQLVVG